MLSGANMAERLAFLHEDMPAYYTHHSVDSRLPVLKESNIKESSEWPELKGNDVKAANTRAFVPYILALQQRAVLIRKTPKNVHMLKAVESLSACYSIVYEGCYFLDGTELGKLREHLDRFGRHYQWLAVTAMADGKLDGIGCNSLITVAIVVM